MPITITPDLGWTASPVRTSCITLPVQPAVWTGGAYSMYRVDMTPSGHLLSPDLGDLRDSATTPVPSDDGWSPLDVTDWISATISQHVMAGTALLLVALLAASIISKRRRQATTKDDENRDEIGAVDRGITRITALIATAVLAEGMWGFFVDVIRVAWPIRVILFSFVEMQIITATRRARRHLYRHGSLGTAPRTVFGLAAASATIAAIHANTLDERLFRLFAAGVAAYMWIEELREERDILHHKNPTKYPPVKRLKLNWAFTPERLFARLGWVEASDRTVSDVDRARRIATFARIAYRLHQLETGGVTGWRLQRAERRLARQVELMNEYLNMATDRSVMADVQKHLATLYQARDGVKKKAVDGLSPWALDTATGHQSAIGADTRPDMTADTNGVAVPDMGPHLTLDMLSALDRKPGRDTLTDTRPDTKAIQGPDVAGDTVTVTRPDRQTPRSRTRSRTSDRTPKWTPPQLRAFKMRDEDDATYSTIARKLSVAEKTVGRWFKERERAEEAQRALAVSPDILSALPEPRKPVTSGTNGRHINVEETPS
ncbi:hypothetical protein AB0B94_30835 [Micromonospora sp. NPDC048986]|uniref:hypothetical protein n=1 Tax=Micromonospora sp. NPDC048986 TaxID=3155644 RepID=UPI0033EE0F2F